MEKTAGNARQPFYSRFYIYSTNLYPLKTKTIYMDNNNEREPLDMGIFHPRKISKHSNALITSNHSYTLLEKKMIYCIINQLDPNLEMQSDRRCDLYFNIPISTFGKDANYESIAKALDKIHGRSIRVHTKNTHFILNPISMGVIKNGIVTLKLQREAIPFFVDLKQYNYTSYQLDIILSLGSVYSQRLYEILKKWEKSPQKKWSIGLPEFKELMQIQDKPAYREFHNILKRIIEPAKKELTERTDIAFTYETEKIWKKVNAIVFTIESKKSNHTLKGDAQAEEFEKMSQAEKWQFIDKAINVFEFDENQKASIKTERKFLEKFLEIFFYFPDDDKILTTHTQYMAGCLKSIGWK